MSHLLLELLKLAGEKECDEMQENEMGAEYIRAGRAGTEREHCNERTLLGILFGECTVMGGPGGVEMTF